MSRAWIVTPILVFVLLGSSAAGTGTAAFEAAFGVRGSTGRTAGTRPPPHGSCITRTAPATLVHRPLLSGDAAATAPEASFGPTVRKGSSWYARRRTALSSLPSKAAAASSSSSSTFLDSSAGVNNSNNNSERKSTKLTINLLSFDGGGVLGALSTRMLAYTLQYVLSGQVDSTPKKTSNGGLGKSFRRRMFKYVDAFDSCHDVMWTYFAQKLDSANIRPQELGVNKWMDYDWNNPSHAETMRSILRIDSAYDFYLAHVLAISGTSTGGILAASTMLRMSLMQLVALYTDPQIIETIFPPGFDFLRPGAGLWQAKYTQKGVADVTDRVIRWSAPGVSPSQPDAFNLNFVSAARTFNECIKTRILGKGLYVAELERMRSTLLAAPPNLQNETVQQQLDRYTACVRDASQYLDLAKAKRYKELDSVDNDSEECLSNLEIKEPSVSYDPKYYATRFLITSQCVNNDAAVVFDSHEPIQEGQEMNARGDLRLANGLSLNVMNMTLKDVVMSTSAAPYYFPVHPVDAKKGGKIMFYFRDGGVMANDPGLINACFAYQHFTPSTQAGRNFYFPVLRLLRLGCGLSVSFTGNPIGPWTLQGANIVAQMPTIFMSADSSRTNLLANVLQQTYSFQDTKLDCYIPATNGEKETDLPMDKVETVLRINDLYGTIDPSLTTSIAVSDAKLVAGLKNGNVPKDLVTSIVTGSVFLRRTESGKTKATKNADAVLAFLEMFR